MSMKKNKKRQKDKTGNPFNHDYFSYKNDYPDYEFYDTLCVSRRVLPDLENHQLQTVAAACGFNMENHHHALADAEACAWIAREIL